MSIRTMSKEDIIKFIQQAYADKEFTNQADFRKDYETYYKRIVKIFGNLANGLDAAGIKHSIQRTYTDKDVEDELRRLASQYGPLSGPLIDKHGKISTCLVQRRFSNVENACKLLDLPFKESTHKFVKKEDLDAEIFRLVDEFGYVSKPIVEKNSKYGPKVVNRIYGNFGNMYEELGLKRHPSGRSPSVESLKKEFLRIYNEYGTISQSIVEKESKYSTTCYKDRFGSFNKLREELGLPIVEAGESTDADYALRKIADYLEEEPIKEKKFEWLRNPKSGYPLRIDGYFSKHKIAVEYNGPQHYKTDGRYCTSKEALSHRKYLDSTKEQLLRDHGIKVVWISYLDKIDNEYLKNTFA